MRNEPKMERLRVASLKELDALVGKYLTKETPQVFWEEQQVCLRFDSIEEALEAMHDPYFQQFIPKDARPHSSLTEVHEFRAYSSDLNCAWEVIDQLNTDGDAVQIHKEHGKWSASFGEHGKVVSHTAPVAICLAALLARGIDVELAMEWPSQGVHGQSRAVA